MDFYLDAWRNFANFSGRATRQQYWMFMLFNLIAMIVIAFLDAILGLSNEPGSGLLSLIYTLAVFIPSLSIFFRRLHDIGRSGWWFLVLFIPLVGLVAWLIFALIDSQPEENQWGPSTKYGQQTEVASA